MNSTPSWLRHDVDDLKKQFQKALLPHGLLVVGQVGNGRTLAIKEITSFLMCSETGFEPCGRCKSCLLVASGNHPDLIILEPEGKSQSIKIDAIRSASQKIWETAQQGGNKVVWIDGAETMNLNAANALLKALEEPTPNTFIIIASNELSAVLPTVRSRCRLVKLAKPNHQQCLYYLNASDLAIEPNLAIGISGGQPILATQLTDQDVVAWEQCEKAFVTFNSLSELSRFIGKQPMTQVLKQVLMWLEVGIKSASGIKLKNEPMADQLVQILGRQGLDSLFKMRDFIIDTISAERRQANLNSQLLAEELAARWLTLRGTI